MTTETNGFKRSEKVQEILEEVPSWFTRWGLTILSGIFAFILLLASSIQYPDMSVNVIEIIGSKPFNVYSNTNGTVKLGCFEGQYVNRGDLIGVVVNSKQDEITYRFRTNFEKLKRNIEINMKENKKLPSDDDLINSLPIAIQDDYLILNNNLNSYNLTMLSRKAGTKPSSQLKTLINESILNISEKLKLWEKDHLSLAPISGKVSYVGYLTNHEYINRADLICAIIPPSEALYGIIKTKEDGIGKIHSKQIVNIKLNKYPSDEFGIIIGQVESISLATDDNDFYTIKVKLPKKLFTTYSSNLPYSPKMKGIAEIIVKDNSLLERLFNNFSRLLTSKKN